jgi:ligand-binding sensor domain-containing protein/signal transduction histidine kinase
MNLRCLILRLGFIATLMASAGHAKTLPLLEFTTANGLPHNRVNSIYRDSRDFLWICTDDGVARFDGHQFVSYTSADGLPHMHINAILETRSGQYWLASDAGITQFDPAPNRNRFTSYLPPPPSEKRYVNTLFEDSDGTLLVGTNGGLVRFVPGVERSNFKEIAFGATSEKHGSAKVNSIARDARGHLWLGTEYGLYERLTSGAWRSYGRDEDFRYPFVFTLVTDSKGRLWAGFRGGFGRIAREPELRHPIFDLIRLFSEGIPFQDARDIFCSGDSRFWIATEAGLFEWVDFLSDGSKFHHYSAAEGFRVEETHAIAQDSAGNLWIGMRRSGLTCIRQTGFRTFNESDGLRLSDEPMLLRSHAGNPCVFDVGGGRRGLFCYDNRIDGFQAIYPALRYRFGDEEPHWLEMAQADPRGGWWFSSTRGMFYLSSLRSLPTLQFAGHITRFYEDSSGDLWAAVMFKDASDKRGLLHWRRSSGKLEDVTGLLPDGSLNGIASFAQDPNGNLWFGLERPGGLLRLRNGRFEIIDNSPPGHTNQLFIDSKSRLWIASTEGGLGRIDEPMSKNPRVRRFGRTDGLSSNEIWSITEDRSGRIYAGTSRGLDRLDLINNSILHFTSEDGLTNGDIRSALRDQSGDLWFTSSHGISRYTPEAADAPRPSAARITGLRIAGVPVPISEFGSNSLGPLNLSSHENSVQIQFGVIDFRFLTHLTYEFRPSLGNAWQPVGPSNSLNLLHLSPGRYHIEVRAVFPGAPAGEVAQLELAVAPPFWKRWWFQIACVLVICGSLFVLHLHQVDKQVSLERIRTQIATDLHDDIGASLSRIHIMGEAIRSNFNRNGNESAGMIGEIVDSSRRLLAEMNDIVWSLNARRDSFTDLANRLRAFGSDVLESRGIQWYVAAPDAHIPSYLTPDKRRQLFVIFKEAIHNVSKHSQARKASLRFWRERDFICAELTDDGCGMAGSSDTATAEGNGMTNMRMRANRLGGTLSVSTGIDGGMRLDVRLPIDKHVYALPRRRRPC